MTDRKILRLVQNKSNLEYLHDRILKRLETRGKNGICQLLKKNNDSVRQILYPYLKSADRDLVGLLEALDTILEVHAKECYAIGVLDSLRWNKEYGISEENLIN